MEVFLIVSLTSAGKNKYGPKGEDLEKELGIKKDQTKGRKKDFKRQRKEYKKEKKHKKKHKN